MPGSVPDAVPSVADLVSALEPVCGVVVAINVSYLALRRFRHLIEISEAARKQQEIFDEGKDTVGKFTALPQNIKEMEYYKCLDALCKFDRKDYSMGENGSLDKGFWPAVFKYIYRKQIDRAIPIAITTVAVFVLCAGVALKIGSWQWTDFLFQPAYVGWWFNFLVLSGAVPVFLGYGGMKVVDDRVKQAAHCRTQIELAIQKDAQQEQLPSGVPFPVKSPSIPA